jgi:hypothetical protein
MLRVIEAGNSDFAFELSLSSCWYKVRFGRYVPVLFMLKFSKVRDVRLIEFVFLPIAMWIGRRARRGKE